MPTAVLFRADAGSLEYGRKIAEVRRLEPWRVLAPAAKKSPGRLPEPGEFTESVNAGGPTAPLSPDYFSRLETQYQERAWRC